MQPGERGKARSEKGRKAKKNRTAPARSFPLTSHNAALHLVYINEKWKYLLYLFLISLLTKKKLKQIYKTSILQDERRKQNEKLRNYKEKHSKIQKTWTSALLQLLHKCNKTKVKIRNKKQKKNKRKTINNMNPSEINIII